MKYRTLGKTGFQVSEIGFGCGNVGGLMVRGSLEERVDAVSHALKLGINYFDTAPQYGNGRSETNLGEVLRELRPDVRVATKVGIAASDLKDLFGVVQSSVETSLKRLGRERLDVLQLHTPVSSEAEKDAPGWSLGLADVLRSGGVADTFERMRSQKLVDYLGFTGLGGTSALHQVVDSGRFDVVQAYYNLLNPTAGMDAPGFAGQDFHKLIDAAAQQRMGVVVIRVMAGGALGGESARIGHASPTVGGTLVPRSEYDEDERRAAKLSFLLKGGIRSVPQAAVVFALGQPNISTVLVGFSDRRQIEEAVACSGEERIAPSEVRRLMELWASDFRDIRT